jgi:hypothetical protein
LCASVVLLLLIAGGCNGLTFDSLSDLLDGSTGGSGSVDDPNGTGNDPNSVDDDPNDGDDDPNDGDDDPNDMDDDPNDMDDDPNDADDDPNDGDDVIVTGDLTAGQTIYEDDCASCHRLGSFDTTGSFSDMSGDGDKLVNDLGTLSGLMSGLVYTDAELADLAAFLDAN